MLIWKTVKPDRPGWYWCRHPDHSSAEIVYVYPAGEGEVVPAGTEVTFPFSVYTGFLWAGPIPEPTYE